MYSPFLITIPLLYNYLVQQLLNNNRKYFLKFYVASSIIGTRMCLVYLLFPRPPKGYTIFHAQYHTLHYAQYHSVFLVKTNKIHANKLKNMCFFLSEGLSERPLGQKLWYKHLSLSILCIYAWRSFWWYLACLTGTRIEEVAFSCYARRYEKVYEKVWLI